MIGSLSREKGRDNDEGPSQGVRIGYRLAVGVYEVTFSEWDACLDAGGCGGMFRMMRVGGAGIVQ